MRKLHLLHTLSILFFFGVNEVHCYADEYPFISNGLELPTNTTTEDETVEEQILAMDRFVMAHLSNKQMPQPEFNQSEFPDMGAFRGVYETGKDKVKIFGICTACRVGIGFLMYKVRVWKAQLPHMERIATFVCQYFKIASTDVCKGGVERYAPVFHFLMKQKTNLSAEAFCGTMLQSHGCTTHDPLFEWRLEIPPLPLENPLKRKVTRKKTGLIKIVQLTDLHIDPLYESGSETVCENRVLCCRGGQRPSNKSLQAGYFGDNRKCDTSPRTFEMTLKHIAEKHGDMDLFYMNGDLVPHNVWETSREVNSKIIHSSAETILKYFPSTKIIPLIGNHETSPVNFFSPYDVPAELSTTWVYNVSYEAFKQWIPPNQIDSYRQFGHYSVDVNSDFRLLIFNSNFCYEWNLWQMYEPKDPGNQQQWLIQELQKAENNNQLVHLIGHVPPGHEECYHVWSRNFYDIVKRFHKTIKAQFYGHTHFDEFKVIYQDGKPINSMWIAPSLTSYDVNNLVYRVYYADPNDYSIMDHETWTFDLNKENEKISNMAHGTNTTDNATVEWFRSYQFTSEFGIPNAKPESLHLLVQKLARDDKLFKLFHKYFYKSLDENYRTRECNTFCKKRLLCTFVRHHTSYHAIDEECSRLHELIDKALFLPFP